MTSVLSVALICACALVCSGSLYDQYPYSGQYKPSVPGKYYPDYRNQDYNGGYYRRYRRSVPSYNDGSYPRQYPSYPTGYKSYPEYPTYHRYPAQKNY